MRFFSFSVLFIAFATHFMPIHAGDQTIPEITENTEQKIYVEVEDLIVDSAGMAIELFGKCYQIFSLFQDDQGYYILAKEIGKYRCAIGHLTPRSDLQCFVQDCPYYFGNPNG